MDSGAGAAPARRKRILSKTFKYEPPSTDRLTTKAPPTSLTKTTRGWTITDAGNYKFNASITKAIPSGMYKIVEEYNAGLCFSPVEVKSDQIIDLPGLPTKYIIDQMENFWSGQEVYEKLRLLHKRGLLLYGEPGGGKTSIIRLLIDRVLEKEGVIVLIDDFHSAVKAMPDIRRQDRLVPLLTLCEDMDEVLDTRGHVGAALSFYDGQHQLNNVLHIATTNYPEKIESRFLKRPGRFDLVIGIHAPAAETRLAYLKAMTADLGVTDTKIKNIVQRTDGMCISYLREIVAAHFGLKEDLDEVIQRLNVNFKKKISSRRKGDLGFSIGYEPEPESEEE